MSVCVLDHRRRTRRAGQFPTAWKTGSNRFISEIYKINAWMPDPAPERRNVHPDSTSGFRTHIAEAGAVAGHEGITGCRAPWLVSFLQLRHPLRISRPHSANIPQIAGRRLQESLRADARRLFKAGFGLNRRGNARRERLSGRERHVEAAGKEPFENLEICR